MSLMLLLPLVACKKTDPEPAVEEAAEVEEAPDPSQMVRIALQTEGERIKVVCKDTGTTVVAPLVDGVASVAGVDGENCFFVVKPGDAQYMGVKGGTSLTCLVDDAGQVQCK